MSARLEAAREVLRAFKGADYVFGLNCLDRVGGLAAAFGRRAAIVGSGVGSGWAAQIHNTVVRSLSDARIELGGDIIPGARPNAPREDVQRIRQAIFEQRPHVVVAAGGGSTIDAVKAATALAVLGRHHPDIEDYFGVGAVTRMLDEEGTTLVPIVAVQLAASSAAHLTRYSNITDTRASQKKLIVDDALVPPRAVFDYAVTATMPRWLTADGALDGLCHALEVLYGAQGAVLEKVRPAALLGIELVLGHVKRACEEPGDLAAREALGLATDLGGYCIMVGGTSGAHLASFSLVDILSHGRACALMNPYYTVFFAPAIEEKLREVGALFAAAGYVRADVEVLKGRELGTAVAEGMRALLRDVGLPTRLAEVAGFSGKHIERALAAAKDPRLEMKLRAMPVPVSAETAEECLRPVFEAARTGDFSVIGNAG